MNSKFKPDPQKVVEFMCDAICRDNGVTGEINFNEGFVTIKGDNGEVWKSEAFIREYKDGVLQQFRILGYDEIYYNKNEVEALASCNLDELDLDPVMKATILEIMDISNAKSN